MERLCEQCGTPLYQFARKDKKYCSTRCKVAAHRNKHKLPARMLKQPRWVNHTTDKRPLNPRTGNNASSTNPNTWGTHAQATQNSSRIGYMLGEGVGCIDLDHCINPDGSLTEGAQEILDSYPNNWVEISPSGDGLHIWGTADEQPGFRRVYKGQPVEFYSRARYITVTGNTYQPGSLQPL